MRWPSDYGTWVEKSMYGRKYMGMERSTFLIDKAGKIAKVWRKVSVHGPRGGGAEGGAGAGLTRQRRRSAHARAHTVMARRWCARPMRAASALWPAITRTPSSSRATMLSGVQPSRNAMPLRRQAANTLSRAACISGG